MLSSDMISAPRKNGWYEVARKGSHVQFRHPNKPGRFTAPHPKRDIPIGTLKSIEKAGRLETEEAPCAIISVSSTRMPTATTAYPFPIFLA
jgi:predicted RNA binding protein YcfA (HicA-like mRNA interferase family)